MSAHTISSTSAFYQYRAQSAPLAELATTLRGSIGPLLVLLADMIGSSYRVKVAFDRHADAQRTVRELRGLPGSTLRDLGMERSMMRTATLDADETLGDLA